MSALPSRIGRYEIKSLIGRGGMGDLYLAWDPNTTRLVALKLLNATLDSRELRERFSREARALAALNHHNIVNIYDTGEFDDSLFIVMEYVRGETLAEMIKRRAALSVSQKLKLMAELCNGLAQAHEAGIIHRDIKPANLMVDQQGRLKILDFGIARVAEGTGTRVRVPLTQVNMVVGTPGYMSPEQIEGGEVDHRSDIFAVGAVCYELFAYGEAFSGTTTGQIERRVLQGQPVPLALVVPGLDPEIDAIVLRALKKDPNRRYQDAATFERDLERLRLRLGPDAPRLPHRPPAPLSQSARGTSRDPRAEAAYQRSLAADEAGAPAAARRFAAEALAHDASHPGARALLARLESGSLRPGTPATGARQEPAPPTVVNTSDRGAVPATVIGTSVTKGPSTIPSAPTIIVAPAGTGALARWKRHLSSWTTGGPLRRRWDQLSKPNRADWNRPQQEPLWRRYRWALLAVAMLVLVAGVVTGALVLVRGLGPSVQVLTISKPVGGTISGAGITCGSLGADCSASHANGDLVELRSEPDAGFAFDRYTGDCAPGGRTLMTAARTCGAIFAPVVAVSASATQLLTIAPVPTGGTIEGVDIICGTKGSVCSVNHPDGAPVELHPTADPGFTFMGFLGDCVPLGHTQMTAPRTCGATFSPTAIANAPRPAAPAGGRGRTSGRGAPSAASNEGSSPVPEGTSAPVAPVSTGGGGGGRQVAPTTTTVVPTTIAVAPPATDDEFAKASIQRVLKDFCDAHEALDPDAVKVVWPKADMESFRRNLNKKAYKAVHCKFADPMFVSLDAKAGIAKVQADLKRVYEHTVSSEPPVEQIVTMTLSRPSQRSPWQIDTAIFTPKPK